MILKVPFLGRRQTALAQVLGVLSHTDIFTLSPMDTTAFLHHHLSSHVSLAHQDGHGSSHLLDLDLGSDLLKATYQDFQ